MTDRPEEERLREAALKNIEVILAARQRAERELIAARDALERRSSELQQQRAWFEVTLASIGDAVITTDAHACVTFLNPVAESMTGWSLPNALGKPLRQVFNIVHEDTREPAPSPVEQVLATGRVVGLANHTSLIALDGREIAIEDSAAPIRNPEGKIAGTVMVFHDVTRRRLAEIALRNSEERLRAMFAQAAVGIVIANLDGRIEEANDKICEILGFTLGELRARTLVDLAHPDDLHSTSDQYRQLVEGLVSTWTLENRYIRRDGTVVYTKTNVTLLRRESRVAQQFVAIIEDITERKRSEEVRSRLAAVVEYSDDAIITKTLDGVISSWNPGAERIFGYSADEVIGKPILMLIPQSHQHEEPSILDRLRRGERIDHYETQRRRKDGELIDVSLTVSPFKDASGKTIGASKIARDITRQKRAEKTLREQAMDNARLFEASQRELASRERAEAALRDTDRRKDEFLATLAHELRNPLAPIRQAVMISDSLNASEDQKRWSHAVIKRQVQHMSLLLDDLLDVSRITRGTLALRVQMTELTAIVDAAIEQARPLIEGKHHQLTKSLPAGQVSFAADPLRLAQVLSNLLTNAAKYTDHGGKIELAATVDAQWVTISVTDNGVGLDADALSQIFVMFSQVTGTQDRSEGGLGIGLALAKGLMRLHNGTIEAFSEGVGRGSKFIVRIPHRAMETEEKFASPRHHLTACGPPPPGAHRRRQSRRCGKPGDAVRDGRPQGDDRLNWQRSARSHREGSPRCRDS